jgi:uncharacterized protein (TIGR03437 family)
MRSRSPAILACAQCVGLAVYLWCIVAYAESIDQLAVSDDGSQIYFASNFRLKGTLRSDNGLDLLYRYSRGVTTVFQAAPTDVLQRIGSPQVSGSGDLVSFVRLQIHPVGRCPAPACPTSYYTEIFRSGQRQNTFAGRIHVSRNGRYLFQNAAWYVNNSNQLYVYKVHDVQNAIDWDVNVLPAATTQGITRDGLVLGFTGRFPPELAIASRTGTTRIETAAPPTWGIINDTGEWVIYETRVDSGTSQLRSFYLPTERDSLVANSVRKGSASISNDGSHLIYITGANSGPGALMLTQLHSGESRVLPIEGSVSEAVIAGFGNVAVIASKENRIMSVNLANGRAELLIDAGQFFRVLNDAIVPGSLHWMKSSYFTSRNALAEFPLPDRLAGLRVLLDEKPMRMMSVSPQEVVFQVPFDWVISTSGHTLTVDVEGQPTDPRYFPFEPVLNTQSVLPHHLRFLGPNFLTLPSETLLIHGDFGSLMSNSNPPHRGEILHTYAVGLGDVAPRPQTGFPTPLDRLFRIVRPIECRIDNSSAQPIEVVFAGLAPGMIGIYQLSFRVPLDAPTTRFGVRCSFSPSYSHGLWVPAPMP